MSSWLVGWYSSRRLKITGSALGLMAAAALGLGAAPAWADDMVQDGSAPKAEAVMAPLAGFKDIKPETPEQEPIFAALNQNMRKTLASYNYDIKSLEDPFLPIKEVRVGIESGPVEDDRLAFTQLKLVAITIPSSGSNALASFEDGAGTSYIMRVGSQFGRSKGKVARIDPTEVTIVEPPRGDSKEPVATVIKLNVLDSTTGVTRHEQETQVQ